MPIAVYTLPVVGIHHLLAHQWLSSFVCRFLIELCGLCLKLSKLYNVLDVDKSIIYVGDFTSGIFGWNYLSHFGQFTVEYWEPFHSISVSLTVADCCSLAGVHLDFSEQAPFSEWSLPMAPRLTSNATTYGSTLGIWTLQTFIWLLISPS